MKPLMMIPLPSLFILQPWKSFSFFAAVRFFIKVRILFPLLQFLYCLKFGNLLLSTKLCSALSPYLDFNHPWLRYPHSLLHLHRKKVMVKLTADLTWKSPHFLNAIKERELDLRGNKIPVIKNLGATELLSCSVFGSKFYPLLCSLVIWFPP